jgi:hypothetical protein
MASINCKNCYYTKETIDDWYCFMTHSYISDLDIDGCEYGEEEE